MKIIRKISWSRCVLIMAGLFFSVISITQAAEPLPQFKIMTETWIPFQFEDNGKLKGVAVDLLVLLLDRVGSTQTRDDIVIYPWARAYSNAQKRKSTILFSVTRTREREKLFKWVGPIYQNITVLIALKERNIQIENPAALQQYRFATVIDDVGESYLQRYGIPLAKMLRNSDRVATIRMLGLNRADIIVQSWQGFAADAKSVGLDPNKFEEIFTINKADICYAFNNETPEWIIKSFQTALNDLRTRGELEELIAAYADKF